MGIFDTPTLHAALVLVDCASCGIPFAMTELLSNRRLEDGKAFFCPNGHNNVYKVSETQKLRDQNASLTHQLEQKAAALASERRRLSEEQASHKSTVNRLNGTRGALTRVKRRVAAGRCPCCSNQFKDLERHMKNQHPKWDPDAHAEALAAAV